MRGSPAVRTPRRRSGRFTSNPKGHRLCLRDAKPGAFPLKRFHGEKGHGGSFRLIPNEIKTLRELMLPESVQVLSRQRAGLVLVTGPTGSGKSTTLAAMIDLINKEQSYHIITLEDPVEFIHPKGKCLIHQRQIGFHVESFASGLRAALREDPDVILVGEMSG